LLALFLACTPEPREIAYGKDLCAYCKMSVVDAQFAAEAVTGKGRVYVFDAIECLVPYVMERTEREFAHVLVSDYSNPGTLVDAQAATYLVSESITSPMGKNLSAFSDQATAQSVKTEKGGKVFNWEGIQAELHND
jgi:copper chaperone NosL